MGVGHHGVDFWVDDTVILLGCQQGAWEGCRSALAVLLLGENAWLEASTLRSLALQLDRKTAVALQPWAERQETFRIQNRGSTAGSQREAS